MKNFLKKRVDSFRYAFRGLKILFQTEVHGKFHILFAFFVIGAGFFFKITTIEWCFVIVSIAMVISAEAFNSAIESVIDLVSPEIHPLAGKAKDLAAGAVLIVAIGAVVLGFIIFLPKVLEWLGWLDFFMSKKTMVL